MLKKINFIGVGLVLSLILIIYQTVSSMIWQFDSNSQSSVMSMLMLCVAVFSVVFTLAKPLSIKSIAFILFVYYFYIILISLFNGYFRIFLNEPTMIVTMAFWIFIYWAFYVFANRNLIELQSLSNIISIFFLCCFILFIRYYLTNLTIGNLIGLNIVYYLIFMLPFVVANKNRKIVFFGIFLCTIAALLSGKRGALIAIIVSWIIWIQSALKDQSFEKRIKRMLLVIGGGFLAYFLIQYFIDKFDLNIIARMNALINGEDESGSGRTEIWFQYLDLIKNGDLLENLFGRGYVAVKRNPEYLIYGLRWAHNDYLQILFDYGVFGFLMFFTIVMKLFYTNVMMKHDGFELYPVFFLSLLIFLVCCMFSMVTIYPQWFLIMAAFWGFSVGVYERRKNEGGLYRVFVSIPMIKTCS